MLEKFFNYLKTLKTKEEANLPLWLPIIFALGIILYFTLEQNNFYVSHIVFLGSLLAGIILLILFGLKELKLFLNQLLYIILWQGFKFLLIIILIISSGFLAAKIRIVNLGTHFVEKSKCFRDLNGTIHEINYKKNYLRSNIKNVRLNNKKFTLSELKKNSDLEKDSKENLHNIIIYNCLVNNIVINLAKELISSFTTKFINKFISKNIIINNNSNNPDDKNNNFPPFHISIIVRTKIENSRKLEVGDQILFSACLQPFKPVITPFGYDFAKFAFFKQIYATGFASSSIKILTESSSLAEPKHNITNIISNIIGRLREEIFHKIKAKMPSPEGDIAAALLVGKRDGIEEQILQEFRSSGTSHLLAISGLHLSLVSLIIFNLLRYLLLISERISINYDIKKIAAFIAIIFSYFYLQIAGAPVSAQRAFIMVSLLFIAIIFDQKVNAQRSIAFAALLILCFAPENIFHPGFQMSFMAVSVLGSFYSKKEKRLASFKAHKKYKEANFFKSSLSKAVANTGNIMINSILITAATTPFTIYHFNYFSLAGIIANLLAIPLTSFIIMPLLIFILILMPVMPSVLILLPYKLAGMAIWLLLKINNITNHFNFTEYYIREFPPYALLVIIIGILWLLIWKTKIKFAGLIIIASGSALALNYNTPDILISEKYIAVKGQDGLLYFLFKDPTNLSNKLALEAKRKANNYVISSWLKQNGQNPNSSLLTYKDYQLANFPRISNAKPNPLPLTLNPQSLKEKEKLVETQIESQGATNYNFPNSNNPNSLPKDLDRRAICAYFQKDKQKLSCEIEIEKINQFLFVYKKGNKKIAFYSGHNFIDSSGYDLVFAPKSRYRDKKYKNKNRNKNENESANEGNENYFNKQNLPDIYAIFLWIKNNKIYITVRTPATERSK